jgi:FixJ family two-component response regulator
MPGNATVYVVHPDPHVRRSVRALTESLHVDCQAFEGLQEFLEAETQTDNAHGCLLIAASRERGGIDLLDQMRLKRPALPVIVTSPQPDPSSEIQALRWGALEFLVDPNGQALESALRRGLQAAESLRRRAQQREQARQACSEIRARLARLTPPERAVLDRVLQGQPNKCIARDLDVSVRTVEQRRRNIMLKMEADSLPDLVRQVTRLQLLQELLD